MNKHLNNWLDKMDGLPEGTSNRNIIKEIKRQKGTDYGVATVNSLRRATGRPEFGKQYKLTGKTGEKCISNGNTWKESEVKPKKI